MPPRRNHPSSKNREASAKSPPQLIGFECRVCSTRLYGPSNQVGKKMKCPDCGAGTVIPEPPKPKQKNMPAALEGEQYELWDVDDQPLPSELIAAQPEIYRDDMSPVRIAHPRQPRIRSVNDRLYDCGAAQIVPAAKAALRNESVLAARFAHTATRSGRRSWGTTTGDADVAPANGVAEVQQDAAFTTQRWKNPSAPGKPTDNRYAWPTACHVFPLLTGITCVSVLMRVALERWMILIRRLVAQLRGC